MIVKVFNSASFTPMALADAGGRLPQDAHARDYILDGVKEVDFTKGRIHVPPAKPTAWYDYAFVNVQRRDNPSVTESFSAIGEVYICNDDGKTIERMTFGAGAVNDGEPAPVARTPESK